MNTNPMYFSMSMYTLVNDFTGWDEHLSSRSDQENVIHISQRSVPGTGIHIGSLVPRLLYVDTDIAALDVS